LPPLFAEILKVFHSFMEVHKYEPRGPAIFNRQLAQRREDARRRFHRETFDRYRLDELVADARDYARPHFDTADDGIEIRVRGQHDRLIFAGDAELQPPQKSSCVTVEPSSFSTL
jgi:hypothetical protein